MNLAADLGGAFITLDVTTLAFAHIINMREAASQWAHLITQM